MAAIVAESSGPRSAPVVIWTYAHAGAGQLTRLLAADTGLACTSGTGLLPLCHTAAATWQRVEQQDRAPSALALRSIRSMVSVMATVLLSSTGAARWCEAALASRAAAETFLRVFPEAKFLCLHRRLEGVLAESLQVYPWGLSGSPFWPYSDSYPGNNAAAVTAYWGDRTQELLDFEDAHPASCVRVRIEDLTAEPDDQARRIFARLGLRTPGGLDRGPLSKTGPQAAGGRPALPALQLPPLLYAKASKLHADLGYADFLPALTAARPELASGGRPATP